MVESVSIALFHPGLDAPLATQVVATETIDASEYGLRIYTDKPVDPDRLFDLCVELKGQVKRYLLTGESRWCRYNEAQQKYEVGIAIRNGVGTDSSEWKTAIGKVKESRTCEE